MATTEAPPTSTGEPSMDDSGPEATVCKQRMQAAAGAVFNTTELLEMILLQLPLPAILRFQRVNKFAQKTIQESVHLQKALFLHPSDPKGAGDKLTFNPLFDASARFWSEVHLPFKRLEWAEGGLPFQKRLYLTFDLKPNHLKHYVLMTKRERETIKSESWRRMYLASPQAERLIPHYWVDEEVKDLVPVIRRGLGSLGSKATMGTVIDWLKKSYELRVEEAMVGPDHEWGPDYLGQI